MLSIYILALSIFLTIHKTLMKTGLLVSRYIAIYKNKFPHSFLLHFQHKFPPFVSCTKASTPSVHRAKMSEKKRKIPLSIFRFFYYSSISLYCFSPITSFPCTTSLTFKKGLSAASCIKITSEP